MPLWAGEARGQQVVLVGRSAVSRPSSTVAIIPHSAHEIRQNVTLCSVFPASKTVTMPSLPPVVSRHHIGYM